MTYVNVTSVRLSLFGDPAYPPTDWLLNVYTHSQNLTADEESFNAYLSCAMATVETAFGRLNSHWRVIIKRSDVHYNFTPHVIATYCALHNFEGVEGG